MRMTVAIGLMVLLAVFAVTLITWLSSRPSVGLRAAGALLSGVVSIYCLIYVVALIVESAKNFKISTAAMIVIFAGGCPKFRVWGIA
jgi:hypothetical protein